MSEIRSSVEGGYFLHILYLHTHDTGRYIEPYGYPVSSPHLDGLAEEGTLFRNAFSAAPTCSPSRAGLLTGSTPHQQGMLGLAHRGFSLKNYDRHLANYLQNYGYETVLCGMQHVAAEAEDIGYDKIIGLSEDGNPAGEYDEGEELSDATAIDRQNAVRAREYLQGIPEVLEEGKEAFFLSLGLINTHLPFPAVGEDVDADRLKPFHPLPDHPDVRKDMAEFQASLSVVDDIAGEILAALENTGLDGETLVIFTTDHGLPFPRMKCTLYDEGIGVALILKYPGNPAAGEVEEALVSQLDIFPTICDLLDIDRPDWLEGNSLLPLLQGSQEKIRDEIYGEITFHAAYEPVRCIRTDRYKYIRNFSGASGPIPANVDKSRTRELLEKSGFYKLRENAKPEAGAEKPEEELYDLLLDPGERENRADSPEYRDIKEDLKDRLKNWMKRTDDPLLEGPVDVPEGAKINRPGSDPESDAPGDYI